MPIINRFAEFHDEIQSWRHDLHAHPELQFEVHRTAGFVAQKLREFGVDEVVEGIGRTGVVGVIRGRGSAGSKILGLRADMDALPIQELRETAYKSQNNGCMHACGHDGHSAMLLGAAKYLCETRNFDGTAVVIFQPAEEGGGGGREMVEDGLMERFGIEQVFGMHNMPGLPVGQFSIRPGSQLASVDFFTITIDGRGGHAARPNECIDPAVVVSQLIAGFQTIVARNV
ncbi:MAG: amidohydrolase, partial [Hyphomicrobiaceae bacterium]